jgi:hypothetical protein
MCLYIKRSQEENERDLQKFLGDQEEIFVYKILYRRTHENFYRSLVYSHFKWNFEKQKIFQVDKSRISKEELEWGEVLYGLHAYTSLKAARNYCFDRDEVFVKFKVKAEDIIAVENRANTLTNCLELRKLRPNLQRLVCRKLEFVEVL